MNNVSTSFARPFVECYTETLFDHWSFAFELVSATINTCNNIVLCNADLIEHILI